MAKRFKFLTSFFLFILSTIAHGSDQAIPILTPEIIEYEDFERGDTETLDRLKLALFRDGLIGIRNIPGYKEKLFNLFKTSKRFFSLSEETKEKYAPRPGDVFRGYECGKEKFQRPDGKWVIDDLKTSFYAFTPDSDINIWPEEIDLNTPLIQMGELMAEMGRSVIKSINLFRSYADFDVEDCKTLARLLYYRKGEGTEKDNPVWCGDHFDHGLFTVLLPALYVKNNSVVEEPMEAGLFVKTDNGYKKVIANDHNVLFFQVGEFGQLISDDRIRATKHKVKKAFGKVERYTMALFYNAPMDLEIRSTSKLTSDPRYPGRSGDPCCYKQWNKASFERFLVKDDK